MLVGDGGGLVTGVCAFPCRWINLVSVGSLEHSVIHHILDIAKPHRSRKQTNARPILLSGDRIVGSPLRNRLTGSRFTIPLILIYSSMIEHNSAVVNLPVVSMETYPTPIYVMDGDGLATASKQVVYY